MNRSALTISVLVLASLLAACGAAGASSNSFRGTGTRTLNAESKLALGTIKLEGTKQAVDGKMAAGLIPYWQLLVQLDSSSSSAPQEVAAVLDGIKANMTPDQVKSIESMTLTQADMFAVFQQAAQASGSGAGNGGGGSGSNRGNGGGFAFGGGGGNRTGGARPGGGFVFAGGPGEGVGPGGPRNTTNNGSTTGTQTTAAQAALAAQAREKATAVLLMNQVVRLLETKLAR